MIKCTTLIECKDNQISSAKEIIRNSNLRKYIWFSIVSTIVLNIIAITKCCDGIKNLDKTHLVSFITLYLLSTYRFPI